MPKNLDCMKRTDFMGSADCYYSQADIIKEFAREFEIPVWQAKEYVDILFDIIIDHLSDNDNVEIRLYNGLTITTNFLPSKENHLTNITTGKDKMIKVGLKVSRKLKTLLYEMNKDKEKEHSASQSSTNK